MVAFCAEQRLLLHARNPFDGNGVSWGLPRAPQPTQRRVVQLSIKGDRQTVQRWLDDLLPHRADAEPHVRWAYSADEPPQPMPMRKDRQPHPLMFPFLPQPLRAFIVFCRSTTGWCRYAAKS